MLFFYVGTGRAEHRDNVLGILFFSLLDVFECRKSSSGHGCCPLCCWWSLDVRLFYSIVAESQETLFFPLMSIGPVTFF
jgi:hypothetical protein